MMTIPTLFAVEFSPVLARGRGFGRLLEGLYNGDPVAWGITGVVVVVIIGIGVFKRVTGGEE